MIRELSGEEPYGMPSRGLGKWVEGARGSGWYIGYL